MWIILHDLYDIEKELIKEYKEKEEVNQWCSPVHIRKIALEMRRMSAKIRKSLLLKKNG